MSQLDPKSNGHSKVLLRPADHGASAPTTLNISADCRGYRWAKIVLNIGTIAGTSIAWKVQESSDDSSFSDITGAAGTTITTSNDVALQAIVIDMLPRARYVKLAFTYTSITASPMAATCELSNVLDSSMLGSEVVAIVT